MTAAPAAPSRTAEAEALGAALPALLVASDQLAATVALGGHGRRRAGLGDAFWQYRPAQPADPSRLIDWRRSARGDLTFVREREAETAQTVMLWIDRSRAMAFSGAPSRPPKAERAALLGLALGALMLRAGERVGLMAEAGAGADPATARRAAPRGGRAQLLRLAEAGDPPDPAEYGAPAPAGLAPHGQAVLFSDFLGPFAPVAELLDREWPAGTDGTSFLPTLLGRAHEQAEHPFLFWEFPEYGGQVAIRMGDWKLVRRQLNKPEAAPTLELYNLAADPAEQHNVADQHPDILRQAADVFAREHTDSEVERFRIPLLEKGLLEGSGLQ